MKQQWRIPAVCVTASALLIVYNYGAQPEFFDAHLARRLFLSPVNELYRHLYSFAATFVVLGLLPATMAGVLWNERASAFGLGFGRRKLASVAAVLVLFGAMLPLLAYASTLPAISAGHPLSRLAARHRNALIVYEVCLFAYIIGSEFFFRGYLLFGLAGTVGDAAIYIQSLPYVLIHLDRPPMEAVAAVPTSIALGYLASRGGSIWYGVILRWLCAAALDVCVIYHPF